LGEVLTLSQNLLPDVEERILRPSGKGAAENLIRLAWGGNLSPGICRNGIPARQYGKSVWGKVQIAGKTQEPVKHR